ncbi:LysE family translocator [Nonomuraea salmonea]|uniref:LysE family translocator n=1 Tax=Nonomuraea salmonea TaxID=46181 RepID=UPI0031E6F40E
MIAIPGPSVLFVSAAPSPTGRRTALATVLGNLLGCYALVLAVALGIGALVQSSATVFTAVKLAGAVYLVYLGVHALRHRGRLRADLTTGKTSGAVICVPSWTACWSVPRTQGPGRLGGPRLVRRLGPAPVDDRRCGRHRADRPRAHRRHRSVRMEASTTPVSATSVPKMRPHQPGPAQLSCWCSGISARRASGMSSPKVSSRCWFITSSAWLMRANRACS